MDTNPPREVQLDRRYIDFIVKHLPTESTDQAHLLELSAGNGRLTRALLEKLGPDNRITAIEEDADLLQEARQGTADDKRVEFMAGPLAEFQPENVSYDGLVSIGLTARSDPASVLARARTWMKPGGFVQLGMPLQGCFQEFIDALREVLEMEDLVQALTALDEMTARIPTGPEAKELLNQIGIQSVDLAIFQENLTVDNASQLVNTHWIQSHCLHHCLEPLRDPGWRAGVLAGVVRVLDTYFPDGLELSLVFGRLSGRLDLPVENGASPESP